MTLHLKKNHDEKLEEKLCDLLSLKKYSVINIYVLAGH